MKEEIKAILQDALPADDGSPRSITIIGGSGDGAGIGNTIIKTDKVIHKTNADPKPGAEHITEEQIARLRSLVNDVIRLESIAKRKPLHYQTVWGAVNGSVKASAARMIPLEKFKDAEKYLLTWIARLSARPTVQKKAPDDVRARRIKFIQVNMKKLDCEDRVR